MPQTDDDDRPLACREGHHELRRDVLLEDHVQRIVEYCTRKGCHYSVTVEGDSRLPAAQLRARLSLVMSEAAADLLVVVFAAAHYAHAVRHRFRAS